MGGSKPFKMIAVLLASAFLCQCGNDGKNEDVDVSLSGTPLTRYTKKTLNDVEIAPNWFNVSLTIKNRSNQLVRVDEVYFYVSVDGEEQSALSFDLSIISKTDADGNIYDYSNYCTYPANGENYSLGACYTSDALVTSNSKIGSTSLPVVQSAVSLYIGGISEQTDKSGVYSVRAELLGVFLSDNVETDRFQKSVYFVTR